MKVNKSLKKILILVFIIGILYFLVLPLLNWYFGYHGYEKEKFRQNSWGNIDEAKFREAFVKNLKYDSNLKLDSFNIFIEKGYKWGYFSSLKTNFNLNNSRFPYQISHTDRTDNKDVVYSFIDNQKFDSINEHKQVFLEKPFIKDTLIMSVGKFKMIKENDRDKLVLDSIGYIKVYN